MNVGNWKQRKMSAKPSHWLFKLPQNIVCKGGGKVGGNHSAPVIVDWEGGGISGYVSFFFPTSNFDLMFCRERDHGLKKEGKCIFLLECLVSH